MNSSSYNFSRTKKVLGATSLLALAGLLVYQVEFNDLNLNSLSADLINQIEEVEIENPPLLDSDIHLNTWLIAGQGITTNEEGKVTHWADFSGNGNDAVNNDLNTAPTLVHETQRGDFNYHPVIEFDGNSFMESVSESAVSDHIFVVFRSTAGDVWFDSSPQTVLGFGSGEVDLGGLSLGSAASNLNHEVFSFNSGEHQAGALSQNYFYPKDIPVLVRVENTELTKTKMYINGSEDVINGSAGEHEMIQEAGFKLGTNTENQLFFEGDIAELIIAEEGISVSEIKSIEDYLGIKYGIPVGFEEDYSFDFGNSTVFDGSFNINIANDVFGIGRYEEMSLGMGKANSSHSFSRSTQPDGILRVGEASDLEAGESLLVGHNDGNADWSGNLTPDGAETLNRTWYMKEVSTQAGVNGVGSIVMSFEMQNKAFEVEPPQAGISYALAFSKDKDFTNGEVHYVYLNDQSNDGDVQGGDAYFSGTLQNTQNLNYFTLVKFGPQPASIQIDSMEQIDLESGKVEIKATITDINPEDSLEIRTEFELNPDGKCNGPWVQASINGPVTGTHGNPVLLNQQQQEENKDYQISNISTQEKSNNQVSFVWNAGNDVAESLINEESSEHCLRFFVRDPAIEGEMETAHLILKGVPELEEVKTAEIKVKVSAPEDLVATEVSISNNAANEVLINNQQSQDFLVEANLDYQVTCHPQEGFSVITEPQPYLIEAIKVDTSQTVKCAYVKEDEEEDPEQQPEEEQEQEEDPVDEPVEEQPEQGQQTEGTAALKVVVTGLNSGSVSIEVSNDVANNVDLHNDSEVSYVIDSGIEHEVTCQEDVSDHFLINGTNPSKITLNDGEEFTFTCEYSPGDPDDGTVEYTPEIVEEIFEKELACLEYDPERRNLEFTDLGNLNLIGARSATILRDSYLLGGIKSDELQEIQAQFLLSGGGSTIGLSEQIEAEANVLGLVSRADALKFAMLSFCIPVFDSDSLEGIDLRANGQPVPVFADEPRDRTVTKNIVATAKILGIVDGTNYEGKVDPNAPNLVEWERPVTKEEFTKMLINTQQLWQGYQINPDFEEAKALNLDNSWSYPFYARALGGGEESAIEEVESMMQNISLPMRRGQMFDLTLLTLLKEGLYKDSETVKAAFEGL